VLLQAISRFNPERGFRFSTYAMHAIRRRLLRYVKSKHRKRQSEAPWNDDATSSDDRRWTLAYEQRISANVTKLERLLTRLSPRERYVLRSRFGWGREFDARTLQQVADEFGVSRERIRQLESRALKKLRAMAKEAKLED
jgi:RNA polymerase primary sigma factor